MIKKFLSQIVFLLTALTVFASYDMGNLSLFTVRSSSLSEELENSSAEVKVLSQEDIALLHAETVADVLNTISGVGFSSSGSLGSLQNVNIRGMGASRTVVCINGQPVNSAFDSAFNLAVIPVDVIERIEVVSSGSAKGGKIAACGGIVNIITKKTSSDLVNFGLENGSFVLDKASVFDSQKASLSMSGRFGSFDTLFSLSGTRASNSYVYKLGSENALRKNADMWEASSYLSAQGKLGLCLVSSENIISYMHAGLPGSVDALSLSDFQNSFTFSSSNFVKKDNMKVSASYIYTPIKGSSWGNFDHKKHSANVGFELFFDKVSPYVNLSYDYVSSTNIGKNRRFVPKLGFSSAFEAGNFTFYPAAEILWVSKINSFSFSASAAVAFTGFTGWEFSLKGSYAKRLPSFEELYWPFMGNENLKPESTLAGDFCVSYEGSSFSFNSNFFAKKMYDAIAYNAANNYIPENIEKSFYYGVDAAVGVNLGSFSASCGWLYNCSKNLETLEPVYNIRKHNVTFSASYDFGKLKLNVNGKYYGSYYYYGSYMGEAFVMNMGLDCAVSDSFAFYIKADNLLNSSYELSHGYPMPGLKIRLGLKWSAK